MLEKPSDFSICENAKCANKKLECAFTVLLRRLGHVSYSLITRPLPKIPHFSNAHEID